MCEMRFEKKGVWIITETKLSYSAIVSDANFPTFKNLRFLLDTAETVIYFSKETKQYSSNSVDCLRIASALCWKHGFYKKGWLISKMVSDVKPQLQTVLIRMQKKIEAHQNV